MTTLKIKRGDTRNGIEAMLKTPAGTPVNLTGCTVRFHMGKKIVGGYAEVLDAAAGRVLYALEASAVDDCKSYRAEFEVTYPDGRVETFPNQTYLVITIIPDLG